MKFRIFKIVLVGFFLILSGLKASAQKEIFIKRIEFKLDVISDIEYENEQFITIKFNKGAKYVFRIQNHIEDYKGEAVMQLLDADQLIMTNLLSGGKYIPALGFQCNKTGFYDILITFRDNHLGNSVIDILMVQ